MVLSKDDDGEGLFSKSIRVWTKNIEGEQESFKSSHAPLGYPRNITVHPTDRGLRVTWLPPEYGLENLNKYFVRWNQDEYLLGSAETQNTSYLSMNFNSTNLSLSNS